MVWLQGLVASFIGPLELVVGQGLDFFSHLHGSLKMVHHMIVRGQLHVSKRGGKNSDEINNI